MRPILKPIVIGLSGPKRCGKDTVANYLVEHHGFYKMAFADPLRSAASAIFGWSIEQMTSDDRKEVVDEYWGVSPRRGLQLLGTDAVRNNIGQETWVRAARLRIDAWASAMAGSGGHARIVLSDARFPNESDVVLDGYSGAVWRIDRPGYEAAPDSHISERALDDYPRFSGFIHNTSDLAWLMLQADAMFTNFLLTMKVGIDTQTSHEDGGAR